MSKLSEVFQIRLTAEEKVMLYKLASRKKPMSMVIRDLIRKAYSQVGE